MNKQYRARKVIKWPAGHKRRPFSPKVRFKPITYVLPLPPSGSSTIYGFNYDGILVSESHKRLPNGAWSGGGPLYVRHESLIHVGRGLNHSKWGSGGYYTPTGVVPAPTTVPAMPQPDLVAAGQDVDQYGLGGYNKTRPGNPIADAFVAGKETSSDGLPAIPLVGGLFEFGTDSRGFPRGVSFRDIPGRVRALLGNFRSLAKFAGGQYLNIVFGWMPFLRDLRKLFRAMQNMQAEIDKIIRENGRKIHRKAKLLDEKDVVQTGQDYNLPFYNVYGAPPNWFPGSTSYTVTTRTRRRVWYSAAYRYWIPDTESLVWRGKAILALLGALPTPGALWDAMPWTWLTGWFGDLGDLYDSISPNAVDGLVQLYGFTMLNTHKEVEWRSHVTLPPVEKHDSFGGQHTDGCNFAFKSVHKTEEKIRGGGYNPFGPNLKTPDDLSAGQLAILAALGLSRSKL